MMGALGDQSDLDLFLLKQLGSHALRLVLKPN